MSSDAVAEEWNSAAFDRDYQISLSMRDFLPASTGSIGLRYLVQRPKSGRTPSGENFERKRENRDMSSVVKLKGWVSLGDVDFYGFSTTPADICGEQISLKHSPHDAYKERINALQIAASEDEISLNASSVNDFHAFIDSEPNLIRSNLVLMDNGNLRAVWKDEIGTHLGLQFLGNGMVQYVIFKQRRKNDPFSRVAGRDTFEGLKGQIVGFELCSLIYE